MADPAENMQQSTKEQSYSSASEPLNNSDEHSSSHANSSTTTAPQESIFSRDEPRSTDILEKYLDRIAHFVSQKEWPRVPCPSCEHHPSRHIYCFDCCRLLIPSSDIPSSIRNDKSLQLPFALDIILQDRRASSTGVQMATLLNHDTQQQQQHRPKEEDSVRLIDLDQNQPLPRYDTSSSDNEFPVVLFPCPESVPLSSIQQRMKESTASRTTTIGGAGAISDNSRKQQSSSSNDNQTQQLPRKLRLIVLDCKWNSYRRILEQLDHLPKVHLDNTTTQPRETYYWRWHNAGPGCLSSAEAVFWAAWDWNQRDELRKDNDSEKSTNPPPLLDLLWLFAVQRALITKRFESGNESFERKIKHLPFSQQAKEEARALRRKQGEEFKRQQQEQNEKRKQQRQDAVDCS